MGGRPADIFAAIEAATGKSLPRDFAATVAAETLRRLRAELRPIAHAAHALTWIRGAESRGVVFAARAHPHQPRSHRPDALLRAAPVLGERRAQGQTGARSFPARGGAQPGRTGGVHRGRGFRPRHRRRGGGGHDADRLRRRQPRPGQACRRSSRHRRPHYRRRHAGARRARSPICAAGEVRFPDATEQVSPGSARTQLSPSARSDWASVSA